MPRNVLTLMDKVERAKQFGMAKKPVQELASDAGRTTAPTTAAETGILGGTPQQQAMAGTPAQRQAATKIAAPSGESELELAQTFRATPETSTAEQAKMTRAKQLATGLGTYGAKVTEWVEGAKQKIYGKDTGARAQLTIDTSGDLFKGVAPANIAPLTEALKQVAVEKDPTKRIELENQINSLLPADAEGKPRTVDTVLTPEQKQQLYASVEQSVTAAVTTGREAALGADKKLTLSDLTNLGTTQDELATLLGVSPAEVSNLTVAQLQQKVEETSRQQFGTTRQIQAGLASTTLSAADRAALRQYLRDVEQTGVAGAESAVVGLASDIDRGRQVTFGGKQYTVEELLESEALNELVKQVIANPTGDIAKQLAKTEPDLTKWIDDNKAAISTLITQSGEASKAYGKLQQANVQTLGAIGKYQPQLSKDLGYDPKALRAGAIDAATLPGAFQSLAEITDEGEQKAAAGVLAQISKAAPGQVKDLNKDEVDLLDLTNPEGPAAEFAAAAKDQQRITKLSDPKAVLAEYSAGDESPEEIEAAFSGAALATALGIDAGNASELDVDKDGKFTKVDVDAIKAKVSTALPSLKSFAQGAKLPAVRNTFKLGLPQPRGEEGATFNTLQKVLQDGSISEDEIVGLSQLGVNPDTLDKLASRPVAKIPGGDQVPGALAEAANRAAQVEADTAIRTHAKLSSDDVSALRNINPQPVWADEARDSIQKLNQAIDGLTTAGQSSQSAKTRGIINSYINELQSKKSMLESGFAGVSTYAERPSPSTEGGGGGAPSVPDSRTSGPLFGVDLPRTISEKAGSVVKTLRKLRF